MSAAQQSHLDQQMSTKRQATDPSSALVLGGIATLKPLSGAQIGAERERGHPYTRWRLRHAVWILPPSGARGGSPVVDRCGAHVPAGGKAAPTHLASARLSERRARRSGASRTHESGPGQSGREDVTRWLSRRHGRRGTPRRDGGGNTGRGTGGAPSAIRRARARHTHARPRAGSPSSPASSASSLLAARCGGVDGRMIAG
ncbi:hypothetical protein HPB48_004389 [Haemaphysalis longicornis]|uniref:Uncharacterized protein n=1 Tax=Haemaphysalis longicornis TaxID=44386 RepID=A0A9J6G075_HAELO|nr:hypothetical protein HPB48_004389 [Haemaphysalis longicornis]